MVNEDSFDDCSRARPPTRPLMRARNPAKLGRGGVALRIRFEGTWSLGETSFETECRETSVA
jgi:hypothetical protein